MGWATAFVNPYAAFFALIVKGADVLAGIAQATGFTFPARAKLVIAIL
jgi:hypothetical protein